MRNSLKIFITLLIITAVIAGLSFWLLYVLDDAGLRISGLGEMIKEEKSKETAFESVRQALNDSGSGSKKLDDYFVDKNNVVSFVEKIEGLGRKAGVKSEISSLNSSKFKGPNREELEKVSIKIKAVGYWDNIYSLVSYTESLPYKIEINKVVFSIVDPKKWPRQWNVEIELSVLEK